MLAFDRAVFSRDRLALALAFDRGTSRTFDVDGRMHVRGCRISKANVCPYFGREIPGYRELALDANRVYMLYRDPEELTKAAATFRNSQLLMLHTVVSAKNPKPEVTVGTVGSEISFDGTYLVADNLTVWDKDGIDLIESEEQNELSCSYKYRADMTPGVTPQGVAYDGVMRDIKGNHVALVRQGRAGPDVIVADALPLELSHMKRPNLLARLIALGVLAPGTYDKEAQVALDAKLAEMTAKDSDPDEDMEDDPENPGQKRKKIQGTAGDPGSPRGANDEATVNAAVDARLKAGGYVTKAEAEQMANDAAAQATTNATAAINALHAAREAVKPLVGVVAMDSAEAVYKFALEKEGVALDGIHASAFAALVAQRVAAKSAAPAKDKQNALAEDGATVSAAIPGLARIARG